MNNKIGFSYALALLLFEIVGHAKSHSFKYSGGLCEHFWSRFVTGSIEPPFRMEVVLAENNAVEMNDAALPPGSAETPTSWTYLPWHPRRCRECRVSRFGMQKPLKTSPWPFMERAVSTNNDSRLQETRPSAHYCTPPMARIDRQNLLIVKLCSGNRWTCAWISIFKTGSWICGDASFAGQALEGQSEQKPCRTHHQHSIHHDMDWASPRLFPGKH